jgi:hypothetical protein
MMLAVTTAASDKTLLTLEEIAAAVGGSSDTAKLVALNNRVAEIIAGACGLQRAGTASLTLREETYTETFRLSCPVYALRLSRKPIVSVLSVDEAGASLAEDYDFEVTGGRSLARLYDDRPTQWAGGKIVVSYKAGWATVPNDLKELASKLALSLWSEQGRDPSLQRVRIDGISERQYWVGSASDPLITAEIMEGLRSGGYLMHEMVY